MIKYEVPIVLIIVSIIPALFHFKIPFSRSLHFLDNWQPRSQNIDWRSFINIYWTYILFVRNIRVTSEKVSFSELIRNSICAIDTSRWLLEWWWMTQIHILRLNENEKKKKMKMHQWRWLFWWLYGNDDLYIWMNGKLSCINDT